MNIAPAIAVNNYPVDGQRRGWVVAMKDPKGVNWAILSDFGRRKDAEVAAHVLTEVCGVDVTWKNVADRVKDNLGSPSVKRLKQKIADRLAW